MIIIEADARPNWRPGLFKSNVGGKRFRRVWWLWFAIAWYDGDLKEYGDTLRAGETVWVDPAAGSRQ